VCSSDLETFLVRRGVRMISTARISSSRPLSPRYGETVVRVSVHTRRQRVPSSRLFHELLQSRLRFESRCQQLGAILKVNCPKLFGALIRGHEFTTRRESAQFLRLVAAARLYAVTDG